RTSCAGLLVKGVADCIRVRGNHGVRVAPGTFVASGPGALSICNAAQPLVGVIAVGRASGYRAAVRRVGLQPSVLIVARAQCVVHAADRVHSVVVPHPRDLVEGTTEQLPLGPDAGNIGEGIAIAGIVIRRDRVATPSNGFLSVPGDVVHETVAHYHRVGPRVTGDEAVEPVVKEE